MGDRTSSQRTSTGSIGVTPSLPAERRCSSAVSVTPERIELENNRGQEEALEEVSEETLNRVNLNLHQNRSESDKDNTKASWKETLQLHLRQEEEEEEEEEEEDEDEEEQEDEEEEEYEEEEDDDEEDGSSEVETSDDQKFSLVSQSVSSATESDITQWDTPLKFDSATSTPPSEALLPATTPSTASFITPPDSSPHDRVTADAHRLPAGGKGRFDDTNPELLPNNPLSLHVKEERSEVRRRGLRGAKETTPFQGPEGGGAKALWRVVFPGNRKDKKTRRGLTLPAQGLRKEAANERRATGVTDESDLDTSGVLRRCSMTPQKNTTFTQQVGLLDLTAQIQRVTVRDEEQQPQYVPHALAFKRAYAIKRRTLKDQAPPSDGQSSCPTEVVGVLVQPHEASSLSMPETLFQRGQDQDLDLDRELDAKIKHRVHRAARRKGKQEQLKRLHKAQMIQRQLQQVEEQQRRLEERGVMVEKALRGEADYWENADEGQDMELHLEGLGRVQSPALMQTWFQLIQQKNSLVRYESELVILARGLELEDRQSRLQQELRERMAVDDHLKEDWELLEERLVLEEMLEVVEQRDALVSLLEEQRLKERQEDQDLEGVMMSQCLGLSWT